MQSLCQPEVVILNFDCILQLPEEFVTLQTPRPHSGHIKAESLREDSGLNIFYNSFMSMCIGHFNVQPRLTINYPLSLLKVWSED